MSTRNNTPEDKIPGHVKSLSLDLTKPMAFKTDIELNALSVFVGKNGMGKSLVLKIIWALGFIADAAHKAKHAMDKEMNSEEIRALAIFTFKNTFTDFDFTGTMQLNYNSGHFIKVVLNEGEIDSLSYDILDMENVIQVKFMSANMRTFTDIKPFLFMRSTLKDKSEGERMGKLLEVYRLYDVIYVESLIRRCPIDISTSVMHQMKESFELEDNLVSFKYDEEKSDFYVVKDTGEKKYLTSYGAGHQSVINMFIANPISHGTT